MSNAIQIERRVGKRGRTLFIVGPISTENEAEAEALAATGQFEISCPLARAIAEINREIPAPVSVPCPEAAPNGRGLLSKFDFE